MQCGLLLTAIWTFLALQNGVQLSRVLGTRQPGETDDCSGSEYRTIRVGKYPKALRPSSKYLDFDNLPETNFTCEGKVIGGYYADIETGCQMFHVCTIGQKGDMTDIKFLCLNGTVFDQETRVCERVDEVDCSKSKDFYDLNLELYNSGFILSEEESNGEEGKVDENGESDKLYDENYDAETEAPSPTTHKGSRTSPSTTTSTTTTTTTTTPKSIIYSTVKPTYSIVIPNTKNKNGAPHIISLHQLSYDSINVPLSPVLPSKPVVGGGSSPPAVYPTLVSNKHPAQQSLENKNLGTHLTGLLPAKDIPTPRPYEYVTTQGYEPGQFHKVHPLDSGLKPPPTSYKPFVPTSTYKPPTYDPYKNHYFPSSTPSPITSILINNYSQKHPSVEEIRPSVPLKRPVVVVSHHFPTLTPAKGGYDDFGGFTGPSAPEPQYLGHKQHPQLQQPRPTVNIQQQHHHHQHKANPTILALQSQQKKVHQLHQEGLEIAEHQIAQITNRNAEISNLRSQKATERKDHFETYPSHRATKEIHVNNGVSLSKPAIAIVTSTSSTSSRVQNKPIITTYVKTVSSTGSGKTAGYKPEPEYKSQLEKLFAAAEHEKEAGGEDDEMEETSEESSDMDLEQLLLAWKLKTNQEVTKEDIERVFSSLDTSKFKNGQTISLSDIFQIMRNDSAEETTRVPPTSYDDYTEEDVPYDPFYKDVPKVHGSPIRLRRSDPDISNERDNDQFEDWQSNEGDEDEAVLVADVVVDAISTATKVTQQRDSVVSLTTTQKSLPETEFRCEGKIPGGFYADLQVDCRLYHVCTYTDNGSLVDHKFFCKDGSKFNQQSKVCEAEDLVDCSSSSKYFQFKENFRIPPTEISVPEVTFELDSKS